MSPSSTSSGTVARVAKLLRVLVESDAPTPLNILAERMGLPASTTHRLLHLLAEQGFVARDARGKDYRVGLELFRIGSLVASRMQVTEVAAGFMQAVVDACDETCMLSLREATTHSFMIARVIYGSHPLRYEVDLYQRSSLVWGAPGRGILAFLPETEIEAAIAIERASPVRTRQRNLASVKQELAQIREAGFAVTKGQNISGAVGISAPIFDAGGVVGALSVTIPESRFNDNKQSEVASIVLAQARRLSKTLGQ